MLFNGHKRTWWLLSDSWSAQGRSSLCVPQGTALARWHWCLLPPLSSETRALHSLRRSLHSSSPLGCLKTYQEKQMIILDSLFQGECREGKGVSTAFPLLGSQWELLLWFLTWHNVSLSWINPKNIKRFLIRLVVLSDIFGITGA